MERLMSEAVIGPKPTKYSFRSMLRLVGILLNAVALAALVRWAIDVSGAATPLEFVTAAYSTTRQLLLGWADPYLQMLMGSANGYLNLHLTLYPYWQDALILFVVFGAAYVRARFVSGEFRSGLRFVFLPITLAVVIFFAAIAVGLVPLRSDDIVTQIAIVGAPLGLYSSIFLDWHDFTQTLLFTFYLICLSAAVAWSVGETFKFVEVLGFWSLAFWLLGNGMNQIFRGLFSRTNRHAWVGAGLIILCGLIAALSRSDSV
jgi:hypothetical protein